MRCRWANPANPLYVRYHDEEWGIPVHDDHRLFEMLVLESFQAGLTWECVLNRRESFRAAFCGFDLDSVCAFDEAQVERLCHDAGIIRNGRKIRAAVANARVFRAIRDAHGSFDAYLWGWSEGRVLRERGLVQSPLSRALARDLGRRGMTFVGPVMMYAYLQAVGVVDGHEEGCFLCRDRRSPDGPQTI